MVKIIAVGDNCIDVYVDKNQVFAGGNSVNVAVYTQRLGHQSAYLGFVGNDDYGKYMIQALNQKDVNTSHVTIKKGATATTKVKIVNNNRILGDYDEGVLKDFQLNDNDIQYIHTFDVMISSIWSKIENQLHLIHIPIAFDFSDKWDSPLWRSVLPHIQFAFYSDDIHSLTEIKKFLIEKKEIGGNIIICTRGEKGSIAYDGQHFYEQGIISCSVVDTLGAGDSFIAGFLCDYFTNQSISQAMKAGAQNSAKTIVYQGAW